MSGEHTLVPGQAAAALAQADTGAPGAGAAPQCAAVDDAVQEMAAADCVAQSAELDEPVAGQALASADFDTGTAQAPQSVETGEPPAAQAEQATASANTDAAAEQAPQAIDPAEAAQATGKPARKTPGGHGHDWDPDKAPAISAAKAAADFVAQIFADVHAPEAVADAAPAEPAAAAIPADTAADTAPADEAAAPAPASESAAHSDLTTLLEGQNILILGLGTSGLAMARWCLRCGAQQLTVADTRAEPPQLAVLQRDLPQARFVCGALDASLVEGRGLHALYRSPGLSPQDIAPVLIAASAEDISTGGELGLFTMALAALRAGQGYAPALLAVTGTNGKTTVTALAGQLVARAGKSVAVAGNIGPTLLDTLAAHLDAGSLPEVWVLELSSFQLDGVTGLEPTAAALLNLTQDHLDWHGAMPAYAAAKARVFGQTGLMLLNREDAAVMQMLAPGAPAPGADTGLQQAAAPAGARAKSAAKAQKPRQRDYLGFGAGLPRRAGDFGIETVAGMSWLVRALALDETRKPAQRRRAAAADAEQAEGDLYIQRLMPAEALQIRGRHNALNALAALALATCAGCALAPMLHGLRAYRGEPHRLQALAVIDGVEYFDDSKGTNVGATVAALTGLGAERQLLVILGGDGKGQDFAPLAAPLARHARAAILIGRDAPLLRAALQPTGVPLFDAQSLPDAVACAAAQAQRGDAVLLSPACASFDMFRNYAQRAQVFCDCVRALADRAQPEGVQ